MPKQDADKTEFRMANRSERICVERSTTTIHELNDHVLCETFQHLDDRELCAVADVCSMFKRNVQAEFSWRYRNKRFHIETRSVTKKAQCVENQIDIRKLPPVLRNFGPVIKSFGLQLTSMSSMKHSKIILGLIFKYFGTELTDIC